MSNTIVFILAATAMNAAGLVDHAAKDIMALAFGAAIVVDIIRAATFLTKTIKEL